MRDAAKQGKAGVAVVTSEGPFMAKKHLFLKNGFKKAQTSDVFTLMVKQLRKEPAPKFKGYEKQLSKYNGLHVVYSNQCPWVARFISEIGDIVKKKGLKISITELETPEQAQNAPSIYAVFNLVHNGKLLADHYISNTRFLNIINKLK